MAEKREHKRYQCFIPVDFDYYEGNPDEIDIDITVPVNSTGHILDISLGGVFIVTNQRVAVNMPIRLYFKTQNKKHEVMGIIIRTGLLKNNPSEIAQKYAAVKVKEDAYIAVQFDKLLEDISENDVK